MKIYQSDSGDVVYISSIDGAIKTLYGELVSTTHLKPVDEHARAVATFINDLATDSVPVKFADVQVASATVVSNELVMMQFSNGNSTIMRYEHALTGIYK